MAFADFLDAKRVLDVLGKRLARYGLTLHPDKTRFVDFRNNRPNGTDHPETDGTTFTFLGFCPRLGQVAERQERGEAGNGKEPLRPRAGGGYRLVSDNRHQSIPEQHAQLVAKMRGHYAYYGISGNFRRLSWYAHKVARIWQKWLSRRVGSRFPWDRFNDLLKRHPLPAARIVHRYTARERISSVKNRKLEIGTSGTVRGEDGNILTYSALRLKWQGQDGQKETEQPDHSVSLSDFTTSSTRIRLSVHTSHERVWNGG